MRWLLLLSVVWATLPETGSYKNPHPRPYERCDANDLIKLSGCCNEVLARLDDCKAEDLACECCALQHMDTDCYNLCPGNPSTNFLTVLFDDCAPLNDVNACNLPFKKEDGEKVVNARPQTYFEEDSNVVSVKSVVQGGSPGGDDSGVLLYNVDDDSREVSERISSGKSENEEDEPAVFLQKPKVVLVNASNASM